MKSPLLLAASLLFVPLASCGTLNPTATGVTQGNPALQNPRDVVNERMRAYNAHDLDAFLAVYADDVDIFTYPNKSMGSGKPKIRGIFEPMFQEGLAKVTIRHQIAKDGYVINHEAVNYGEGDVEYVSIYEVRGGLIRTVSFVRDR
ncbi:MAG: hypothetical protein ACI89X_003192 [Planctomycetota bacterium]|jgi:hypothetical protein